MRKMSAVLIIALIFLFGCTVSREARLQKVKAQHPGWDQATVERVAEGRVEVGMSAEMVLTIMGQPGHVARESHREIWSYMTTEVGNGGELRPAPAFFVYFKEGKVEEIKGSQKRVLTPLLYS